MIVSKARSDSIKGRIFEIQRFSIHDGPGIRTTIFLKGCPLRCLWCHNPEGQVAHPVLSFQPEKCIGCGYCMRVCAAKAHQLKDGRHILSRDICKVCGKCAEECWTRAIELIGRDITVGEAVKEVLRDRQFYETSGGGMTLSGGEPTSQIEFTAALLKAVKGEGINCCIETCGSCPPEKLKKILPLVDLFLFDLKETNDKLHREFTGVSNELIISNLKMLHAEKAKICLRLPVIPGLNDRPDHFKGIASLVKKLPHLSGIEVMPYHSLGKSKNRRLGIQEKTKLSDNSVDKETVCKWIDDLAALGVKTVNQ